LRAISPLLFEKQGEPVIADDPLKVVENLFFRRVKYSNRVNGVKTYYSIFKNLRRKFYLNIKNHSVEFCSAIPIITKTKNCVVVFYPIRRQGGDSNGIGYPENPSGYI